MAWSWVCRCWCRWDCYICTGLLDVITMHIFYIYRKCSVHTQHTQWKQSDYNQWYINNTHTYIYTYIYIYIYIENARSDNIKHTSAYITIPPAPASTHPRPRHLGRQHHYFYAPHNAEGQTWPHNIHKIYTTRATQWAKYTTQKKAGNSYGSPISTPGK